MKSTYEQGDLEQYLGIHIDPLETDDATIVKVLALVGEQVYQTSGTSRRDPRDNSNPEIGAKLALGRAIRQLGRDILKDGQSLVREQDRVKRVQEEASARLREEKNLRSKAIKKELKIK